MTINQAMWSKRPTYEEILRDMEKDYKVKLPDRVALQFYDSFAMAKFRELQQQTTESEAQKDEHRREAVVQAASDSGAGRHELGEFVAQLHQQSQRIDTETLVAICHPQKMNFLTCQSYQIMRKNTASYGTSNVGHLIAWLQKLYQRMFI